MVATVRPSTYDEMFSTLAVERQAWQLALAKLQRDEEPEKASPNPYPYAQTTAKIPRRARMPSPRPTSPAKEGNGARLSFTCAPPELPLPRFVAQSPLRRRHKLGIMAEMKDAAMLSETEIGQSSSIDTAQLNNISQTSSVSARNSRTVVTASPAMRQQPMTSAVSAFRESQKAHDRHVAAALQSQIWDQDEANLTAQEQLNALQQMTALKREELQRLRGELALVVERTALQGRDGAAMSARLDELASQFQQSQERDILADADGEVYVNMIERLSGRRPHLVRKLDFMRSALIELDEQIATAEMAMDVACASKEHWVRRLNVQRQLRNEQEAENDRRERRIMDEMQSLGGYERRRNLELGGQMTPGRLKYLKEQATVERNRLEAELQAQQDAINQRGEIAFEKKMQAVDDEIRKPQVVAAMSSGHLKTQSEKMQEGWQTLAELTSSDHIKGVLEFWEEQVALREALTSAEQDRAERKVDRTIAINKLHDERSMARDLGYSAKLEFDQAVEQMGAKIVAATAACSKAKRASDKLENMLMSVTHSLARFATIFTHPAVVERTQQPAKRALKKHGNQMRDLEKSLVEIHQVERMSPSRAIQMQALPNDAGGDDTSSQIMEPNHEVDKTQVPSADVDHSTFQSQAVSAVAGGSMRFKMAATLLGPADTSHSNEHLDRMSAEHFVHVDPNVLVRKLPKSVQSLLGFEGNREPTGSAMVSDLRAAHAQLTCSTTLLGAITLVDLMEMGGRQIEGNNQQLEPLTSPQLESPRAQANNLRLPAYAPLQKQLVLSSREDSQPTFEADRLGNWARTGPGWGGEMGAPQIVSEEVLETTVTDQLPVNDTVDSDALEAKMDEQQSKRDRLEIKRQARRLVRDMVSVAGHPQKVKLKRAGGSPLSLSGNQHDLLSPVSSTSDQKSPLSLQKLPDVGARSQQASPGWNSPVSNRHNRQLSGAMTMSPSPRGLVKTRIATTTGVVGRA